MMLMTSASPAVCERLINGSQGVLIWRKAPKHVGPFTIYVYCTTESSKRDLVYTRSSSKLMMSHANKAVVSINREEFPIEGVSCKGKVIASFECAAIYPFKVFENGAIQDWNRLGLAKSGLSYEDLAKFVGVNKTGYAVSVDNLTLFGEPMELSDFGSWVETATWRRMLPLRRAPTGYCYVHTIFDKRK